MRRQGSQGNQKGVESYFLLVFLAARLHVRHEFNNREKQVLIAMATKPQEWRSRRQWTTWRINKHPQFFNWRQDIVHFNIFLARINTVPSDWCLDCRKRESMTYFLLRLSKFYKIKNPKFRNVVVWKEVEIKWDIRRANVLSIEITQRSFPIRLRVHDFHSFRFEVFWPYIENWSTKIEHYQETRKKLCKYHQLQISESDESLSISMALFSSFFSQLFFTEQVIKSLWDSSFYDRNAIVF